MCCVCENERLIDQIIKDQKRSSGEIDATILSLCRMKTRKSNWLNTCISGCHHYHGWFLYLSREPLVLYLLLRTTYYSVLLYLLSVAPVAQRYLVTL